MYFKYSQKNLAHLSAYIKQIEILLQDLESHPGTSGETPNPSVAHLCSEIWEAGLKF